MRTFSSIGVVLGLVVLAGCGGESEDGGSAGSGAASTGGTTSGGSGGTTSGGSGGGGGTTGGSGGSATGGTAGAGGAACDALNQQYVDTLKTAQSCNPLIDAPQCTEAINEELMCLCQGAYVNPVNSEAVAKLKQLQTMWNDQKCNEGIGCPAIACEPPTGGACVAGTGSSTGTCQNVYGDGGT